MDIKAVIKRAGEIQKKANEALTLADKKEQIKYAEMIKHPQDKIYLMKLMDESTQISNNSKLVKRVKFLHQKYGMLHFLSPWEKMLFRIFVNFGEFAPSLAVPAFNSYLRSTTAKVIINEAPKKLSEHLQVRKKQNIGQNVNLIGEVVLGEKEALRRYHHYLESLENPKISYMSIKISGIYSQLHPLNFDKSKAILKERLSAIFKKANAYPVKNLDGELKPKFINLDMEEYKDVELTYQVFTETLAKEEFKHLYAGIVIQAYLPDAIGLQNRLIAWAQKRIANGGAPIKMRLVKGANLQMETVQSSLKHWKNPVFDSKVETDANYLKLIDNGFKPEHMKAVHMGIASHNLFSIAYAQRMAVDNQVTDYVSFEMLEGMANNLVKAMHSFGFNIVLYTPVVTNENFLNAVSYLVRRLDENTGEENFIAHSFDLQVDDESWRFLLDQFNQALAIKEDLLESPKRQQNRLKESENIISTKNNFKGEADTNFDLHANLEWAKSIKAKWEHKASDPYVEYPVYVGATESKTTNYKSYIDHSKDNDIVVFKVGTATQAQVEEIIDIAKKDPQGWRAMSADERHEILAKVAGALRKNRGDLIGIMCASTGKTMMEGDVEVSEAIDFTEFYPRTAKTFFQLEGVKTKGKGTILVIPPWNFPLAIPVGGVIAGLAAGNTVIIKPATASAPVAFHFVQLMHEAGVPKEVLQVVLPEDRDSLNYLTKHSAIDHIIFTGGTETAYRILKNNPKVPLSAETGGKNAIIVTSSADKDIAIHSVVQSAFSNAGQKCSACSLLLLQKDIYDDKQFISKLQDATNSLFVGSPWDLSSEIGPMIGKNTDNKVLMQTINNLENGESWLVKPKVKDQRAHLMRPGIKMGVERDSFTFKNEIFAPLLAVVRFNTLDEAIDMVNSTGYGLTSGLHSLDEREHQIWKDKIEAGNLYINRGITGAIVQRQPFGGMKASAFGNGIKAGGPNYVSCFMNFEAKQTASSKSKIETLGLSSALTDALAQDIKKPTTLAAIEDYKKTYNTIFSKATDVSHVVGEDNHLRYLPALSLGFRIRKGDQLSDIIMIAAALEITRAKALVSIAQDFDNSNAAQSLFPQAKVESLKEFSKNASKLKRLRLCSKNSDEEIFDLFASQGVYIADSAPLPCGRVELLNYLQEQSVTAVYHRYGNLGDREI